ncbi:reverse transcriptase [Gossypium australe]|uniref:Reverse transcriptase n=1 Tax=Gossypium australe TaxID=47621 RepID=A0A5B6VTI7_9ROSI|nr:reverse transcriptase [Gossypium australe]
MALKLDMSKVYDRVEWPFIKGVMSRMGFAAGFIDLSFRCISYIQYSILSNGEEGLSFISTRGLRQGDPLSLYLFLFCGEGLSALIRLAGQENRIRGAKVSRDALSITHLMFAGDCILFGEASNRGINVLKEILKEYEACSGQCVNFEKSTVFFSSNVNDQERNLVCQALNVQCSSDLNKYLGLPSMVGRKRKLAFQALKDRSKEVFIKTILQAIPTYSMTCFLLPKSLCLEMENIMNSFWWNKTNGKRGMHWCDWKTLSSNKEEGGLGFRDLNFLILHYWPNKVGIYYVIYFFYLEKLVDCKRPSSERPRGGELEMVRKFLYEKTDGFLATKGLIVRIQVKIQT